jgi:UDP-N-acetylmuramoyl-tripeptide--D-alanyl-D-alanine ligase
MTNTASFTQSDLLHILGAAAEHLPPTTWITGVCTDSRTVQPRNAFIALRGERFDGHDHVAAALSAGAVVAVVEESWVSTADASLRDRLIAVPDTLHALGSFAWYHRRRFTIPVIAIAGAAGKTGTKDLTAHVLATAMTVLKTQANYNNRIGTPLTLLQLTPEHEAAVIEIGTNEPGEIETLCAMVQPTHGLITNIGKEHLEKLIDLDGVEREETALFDYLRDHHGLAFVNADDARLARHAATLPRCITFALDTDADIRPTVRFDAQLHPSIAIVQDEFTFNAPMLVQGLAAARNAVCAVAIAWSLQCTADEIRLGLRTYHPGDVHGYARMTVQEAHGMAILNDCYNANPDSMLLALETLRLYPAERRIAVLGDMRELGLAATAEHDAVLARAITCAHFVIALGPEFHRALQRTPAQNTLAANTHEECARLVREYASANTAVLIKGSRGLAMEHVVAALLTE